MANTPRRPPTPADARVPARGGVGERIDPARRP